MKNQCEQIIQAIRFLPFEFPHPTAWNGHLHFAAWLVKTINPKCIVELGTHWGHSYFSMCQSVREADLETKSYAIDTWIGDPHAGTYGEDVYQAVKKHNDKYYDSFSNLYRMTFDEAVIKFDSNSIDILHIDGLHTYEAVKHDFEIWLPKLSDRGIVMFHDTNVRERGFGVWKLWEELKNDFPNHLEFTHSYGLGVLSINKNRLDGLEWLVPSSEHQNLVKTQFENIGNMQMVKDRAFAIQSELSYCRKILEIYKREISSLKSSLSWKITMPLRFLNDSARKIVAKSNKRVRFIKKKTTNEYQEWIHKNDALDSVKIKEITYKVENLSCKPVISVIMPCYNSNVRFLSKAIESVRNQLYPHWELCIADDASTDPRIRKMIEGYTSKDKRIKVAFRQKNGHISESSNTAFAMADGEWITFLDHDDVLSKNALYEVACAINENPEVLLIYSDEDKIDERGKRSDPHFKSDWNPDLFLSQNYICHLTTIHKSVVNKTKGFRTGFEGSQDYDLILRCLHHLSDAQIHHIPKILYHWRAGSGSTAMDSGAKNYTTDAGIKALKDYLEKRGLDAKVEQGSFPNTYNVKYPIPYPEPLVSIIIPTRDQLPLLEKCMLSILSKTTYSNYEIIIVDNLSTQPETVSFFEKIQKDNKKIKVIQYSKEFNYSATNNFAVKSCLGSIVALVNNDIEVINPDWLSEMVSHSVRPEIGCVGAKLYYSDGRIQHAGVIMGIGGVAGHSHKKSNCNDPGYFSRLKLTQNLSAVTAACLVVRREVYNLVGGFDEDNLKIAFNDVDFCLKVREAGYRNIWTPYAELYHHESASRGYEDTPEKQSRFQKEVNHMIIRWGEILSKDPYYNPNLTLEKEDFSIAR